jgi:hypothetical protein
MVMSVVVAVPMVVRMIMCVAMAMPPLRMAVRVQVHQSYYKELKQSRRASFHTLRRKAWVPHALRFLPARGGRAKGAVLESTP